MTLSQCFLTSQEKKFQSLALVEGGGQKLTAATHSKNTVVHFFIERFSLNT